MRSIERYLLAWNLGALGVGSLLVALASYLVILAEMDEIYDADLRNVAEALGSYQVVGRADAAGVPRRLPLRTDVPDLSEVVTIAWTQDGRLVYSSDPRVKMPFSSQEALTHARIDGQDWVVYTDVSANGVAQAAQRASARRETAAEAASKLFPPLLGLALVVVVLMAFALRRGLRPLDSAANDVAARSAASLGPVALEAVPREIAPLVRAINGLLARLAEALSSQRRFLADAAHELRTPVTALQLQVQLLDRARGEPARRQAVAELQAGIERSRHLVEQLMLVARYGPEGQPVRREPVALGELVRSVVGSMSVKAEQRGIDLGAREVSNPTVPADRNELTVLLNNLVENALRYTPAGGVVDVEADLHEGRAALRVVDDGPGIPPAERARAFDRFHRGPDAQAREAGGSGLGLAIVRSIAERHGADVQLLTAPSGRGLEVRVVFPPALAAAG